MPSRSLSSAAGQPSVGPAGPQAALACVAQGPALYQYACTDVHEYCANLRRWQLDYDQLSAGSFHGSLTSVQFARVEVFREVTSRTLRQCGTLGPDSFTIGIPWREDSVARCNGVTVSGSDVFLMSFDSEIEFVTPDDFEVRGVSASARMMEALAGTLGLPWPRQHARKMIGARASGDQVARLKGMLLYAQESLRLRQDIADDTLAARTLEDSLLVGLLDLATGAAPLHHVGGEGRKRTVDRACDLMLAPELRSMTLLDVCREVGASPRKLAYCFREQLGVAPATYWKVIRLNRARKDLLQGEAGDIYSVAARHGFWHFSQFSLDYKRHFGELPSQTLRRARCAA